MKVVRDLSRLLRPKSIALFGGGWAANVVEQLQNSGFCGQLWPVHPNRDELHGVRCFRSLDELPGVPDASFIGVNREATIDIVAQLQKLGAGGATCFASGFLESDGEGTGGADLQARLVAAAKDMPIIGPNCYGLLNYLDNVALWPDQHGGVAVKRGVGIIAQSSNIAINMTMQKRGVPIAYVVAAGNQAQTGIAEIGNAMLGDERVSTIGLYLEGFGDIRALEAFAAKARLAGKSVVVLKIGRSEKAQLATMTHTASLAGDAAVSSALIRRLGFVEVRSISVFLETLKLLNSVGPLKGNSICSVSCSGGEASLIADLAPKSVKFSDFSDAQEQVLKDALGPLVTVANPLDYHTFIWGDVPKMTEVFSAAMSEGFDLSVFVLDVPRDDLCDPSSFDCAVEAIIAAKALTGGSVAVLACLPENITEALNKQFFDGGVVCLNGMEEGLAAIDAAISLARGKSEDYLPVWLTNDGIDEIDTLNEQQSKSALGKHGVEIPVSFCAKDQKALSVVADDLRFPVALKGLGIAHKTEANAVILDLVDVSSLRDAGSKMPATSEFFVEEMITDSVAEILVGITRDATGLFTLTIGAGGVLAELLEDTASLVLPVCEDDILGALKGLKLYRLLNGYRGKQTADIDAIVSQVSSIVRYAEANKEILVELDVNPLLACVDRCVAVDALIRLQQKGN